MRPMERAVGWILADVAAASRRLGRRPGDRRRPAREERPRAGGVLRHHACGRAQAPRPRARTGPPRLPRRRPVTIGRRGPLLLTDDDETRRTAMRRFG